MVNLGLKQEEFWDMDVQLWKELCRAYKDKMQFYDHQYGAMRYMIYAVNAGKNARMKPEDFLLIQDRKNKHTIPDDEEMMRFFQSFSEVLS